MGVVADSSRNPLSTRSMWRAERPRGRLDAWRNATLGMARGHAAPFAKLFDLFERKIITGKVEQTVQQPSVHSTYAIDAAPIGIPGCPLSAFCTASTERKRRVLMHSLSNAGAGVIVERAVFIRILHFDLRLASACGCEDRRRAPRLVRRVLRSHPRVLQIGIRYP
jgi:hypothetical protein